MGTIKLAADSPQHILDMQSLGKSGIESVIESTGCDKAEKNDKVALLFFENSTRTRLSFELAALNLGCRVLNPNLQNSSIQKGETALDTVTTVAAMGVDQIVLRSGENGFAQQAAERVGNSCRILNAGDGTHQHPSQALTDLYILKSQCGIAWSKLKVGIIGDISHSRVANSLIDGLTLLGAQSLNLIGPAEWLPQTAPSIATCFDSLEEGLQDLNAVVVLRAQWERTPELTRQQITNRQKLVRLQEKHLRIMQEGAIVMHPGPVLWGEEIDRGLLHNQAVKINEQVSTGVRVREALLSQ
jgi:aspartate carbamoyltransferase catalytic subunit